MKRKKRARTDNAESKQADKTPGRRVCPKGSRNRKTMERGVAPAAQGTAPQTWTRQTEKFQKQKGFGTRSHGNHIRKNDQIKSRPPQRSEKEKALGTRAVIAKQISS